MINVCELIDVGKKYNGHVVLDKMNMNIGRDEMVAIMGRSGAGKTTILNIVGLLEKPDYGVVKLFGENSPRMGSIRANRLLRIKLAYLFQNGALVENETVDYNLEIALVYSGKSRPEKQDLKMKVLEQVGLSGALNMRTYALSDGEQQRVAIARVLLKPSELVLADEPTGSLDVGNRDEILRLLRELNARGKAVVIVTHDWHVAEACDRIIKL